MIDLNDKTAFESLYKRLGPLAVTKTMRLTGHRAVAEEIVHDTFLKLWAHSGTFHSLEAIYGWVYKACHNAGIDYLKSAGFRRTVASEPHEEWETIASESQDLLEARQLIERALHGCRPLDAAIFAYYHVDEMSQNEIAGMLNVARKTVERALARCQLVVEQWRKRTDHD